MSDADYDDWKKHQDRGQFERERYERTGVSDWGDGGGTRHRGPSAEDIARQNHRGLSPPQIAGLPEWSYIYHNVWRLELSGIVIDWDSRDCSGHDGRQIEIALKVKATGKHEKRYARKGYLRSESMYESSLGEAASYRLALLLKAHGCEHMSLAEKSAAEAWFIPYIPRSY